MGFYRGGSKYRAKKTTIDGIKFDSKSEAGFYQKIKNSARFDILEMQPKVYLTDARILYKPDFLVLDKRTSEKFYVDVKGMRTAVFAIKARLWRFYGILPLKIFVQKKGLYILTELILPNKQKKKTPLTEEVI